MSQHDDRRIQDLNYKFCQKLKSVCMLPQDRQANYIADLEKMLRDGAQPYDYYARTGIQDYELVLSPLQHVIDTRPINAIAKLLIKYSKNQAQVEKYTKIATERGLHDLVEIFTGLDIGLEDTPPPYTAAHAALAAASHTAAEACADVVMCDASTMTDLTMADLDALMALIGNSN